MGIRRRGRGGKKSRAMKEQDARLQHVANALYAAIDCKAPNDHDYAAQELQRLAWLQRNNHITRGAVLRRLSGLLGEWLEAEGDEVGECWDAMVEFGRQE